MDEEGDDYGMPIPNYATGIHILLLDSDTTSLMYTTSLLEEATYRVTRTKFPNIALSMIQEQGNDYDLITAAMDMQGMDSLTFLRIAKTVSDIPIVLTSYKMDEQLAIRAIQQGACQFIEKPISRYDARGLWQYVFRNGRKRSGNDFRKELHKSDPQRLISNLKGKGKPSKCLTENETEHRIQRRKISDNGNQEIGNNDNTNVYSDKRMDKKFENNKAKWNSELHAKFMNVLAMDSEQAIPTTTQQDFGGTNLTVLADQHSTEQAKCPRINITTPTNTSNGQIQLQMSGFQETAGSITVLDARNKIKIPGDNLRLHSTDVVSSPVTTEGLSYLSVQNNCAQSRTARDRGSRLPTQSFRDTEKDRARSHLLSTTKLNLGKDTSQIGVLDGARSTCKTSVVCNTSKQLVVNETIDSPSNLRGRIDKIRRAYWTNTISATGKPSTMPDRQQNRALNVFEDYRYDGSGTINFGFSPSLHACPPNAALYAVQPSCTSSKSCVQYYAHSSCNLQEETTGFCYPISGNDNNILLPSDGLADQDITCTNNLGGKALEDLRVTDSSEKILKDAHADNSQQLTDDDIFLDAILAEIRNDYGTSDLKSLGFSTSSDVSGWT